MNVRCYGLLLYSQEVFLFNSLPDDKILDWSKLKQANSPFLTMFSTLCGTYFPFSMHFKMSSAICFTLYQSKILSSGNGLSVGLVIWRS